jgi:AcrR family transcriptional regulator
LATFKFDISGQAVIIAADGIEAVTIRTLAERAEIATGSIYMHFADTKELIIAVATELRDRDIDAMRAAAQEERPIPILIAGIGNSSTITDPDMSEHRANFHVLSTVNTLF